MNRITKIVGAVVITVLIVLVAVISLGVVRTGEEKSFGVARKTGEEKMEDTKNIAMYVPYGDGPYIMVDQENGSIYTITMPENMYNKDGKKITVDDLKKGNIVAIYGNGIMLESYPGQYPGVTKVEVIEEGKESDADQYNEIIDQIYQKPNPADRPAINIEYRTDLVVVSSIASEGSYTWNYTDAEGATHSDSSDSPHILTRDDLIDLTIDEKTTRLSLTFTSAPKDVKVVRWPVELRESDKSTTKFPEGESLDVTHQDNTYMIANIQADYIYQVTASWSGGTVEYGFFTK